MAELFGFLLVMSLTATLTALVVFALRALLKRLNAPKLVVFLLWAVVLFRMVFPTSFESALSVLGLLPQAPVTVQVVNSPPLTADDAKRLAPYISSYYDPEGEPAPPSVPRPETSAPRSAIRLLFLPMTALSAAWAVGALALCAWALVSYLRLKSKVRAAVKTGDGAWESDRVDSPFVLGFFSPKIYLPLGLSEDAREYVLLHERTHIRRGDHIVKAASFLALALHWFNPVLWLAWTLACRDMEAACDESLLRNSPRDIRQSYSSALLSLGSVRPAHTPLAFGENDVKGRIRGVLKYRAPVTAVVLASALVVVLTGFALAADPIPLPGGAERLSVELPSFDTLELTPGGAWEDAPLVSELPGTIDLDFRPYFERGPDEVTVTDYLLDGSSAPPSVSYDVEGYRGERYLRIKAHPASAGTGTELRGFEILCRWRSGVSSYECRYLLRVRTPVQPVTQPVVMTAGQEVRLAGEDIFPYLSSIYPTPVSIGDIVNICHPQDGAIGYHAQLFRPDDTEEHWISLNQGFGANSVDKAPINGSSGFRLSEEDTGLLMLKLTYTYPDSTQKVWQGLLEATAE